MDSDKFTLFTDASGTLGFGGLFRTHWFSSTWPQHLHCKSINFKELFAVVVAVCTWGHMWRNKQILIFSDNLPICMCWQSRSAKDPDLMRLLRYMFFRAARLNCNIILQHVPGHSNQLADFLSRLQVCKFQQAAPHMDPGPTSIPRDVWTI